VPPPYDPHALTIAHMRAELEDEVTLGLAGSLNMRRTAMRLHTILLPRVADWAVLIVSDHSTGALYLFGGSEPGYTSMVSHAALTETALDRVLRTGRTELLPVANDFMASESLAALVPDGALCVQAAALRPTDAVAVGLTARGATFGALVLVRAQGRGYDDDELAFIERITSRAAIALDTARMYEERTRIAAALTKSLRPPTVPDIAGLRMAARYRPAAEHLEIGGDFYDIHGAGDDWVVSIGDVAGKGVEVAALTGRTRQSIRTAAHFNRSPARLLAAVNTVLYESGSQLFVTVVCARVRSTAHGRHANVQLAAAGHPAPILLRSDGTVEQTDVRGAAVGMQARVHYRSTSVKLLRGDTLLMFTDGIEEARGSQGMYGVARLLKLLPAYAGADPDVICEAVEQDVFEYLDGKPHDDMALLAITCGG
jgi:phosphoserine phosphatase RsbU/P